MRIVLLITSKLNPHGRIISVWYVEFILKILLFTKLMKHRIRWIWLVEKINSLRFIYVSMKKVLWRNVCVYIWRLSDPVAFSVSWKSVFNFDLKTWKIENNLEFTVIIAFINTLYDYILVTKIISDFESTIYIPTCENFLLSYNTDPTLHRINI